jgi:pimeloyl-ACP methyl ester carboxylesterase
MKLVKWTGIVLLLFYVLMCSVLYFNQEKLVFLPRELPESHKYRDGAEVLVNVDENINLSCLYIEKPASEGVVLYLHGNKGNNRRCLNQAYQFNLPSYSLFMPDYRGFGKSDGRPVSEKQMLDDVQKVYDFIRKEYNPQKIIVVGYSLGSGMASYLAENNKVDELFLIAPFTSISDLKDEKYIPVPDFLVKYNFDTASRVERITCPITIFHSPQDEIIPYHCALKLKSLNPNAIDLITLVNVSHRSTIFNGKVANIFSSKIIK